MSDGDDDYGYVVKVWCRSSNPGHRRQGNLVGAWVSAGDNTWTPHIRSRKLRESLTAPGASTPDPGTTLYGNSTSRDDANTSARARSVYTLACSICSPGHTPLGSEHSNLRQSSVPLTEQSLFELFNGMRRAGLHDLDIAQVRTIMSSRV